MSMFANFVLAVAFETDRIVMSYPTGTRVGFHRKKYEQPALRAARFVSSQLCEQQAL